MYRAGRIRTVIRMPPITIPQLSRLAILGVWAAAALPMAALAWLVAPRVAGVLDGPHAFTRALIGCLTLGLAWQAVLVLALVRREQGTWSPAVLRRALWLTRPTDPRTGRHSRRAWLLVPVLVVGFGLEELVPAISHPGSHDMGVLLDSPAGHAFLHGNWTWFAVIVALLVLNTVVGEELLFRGFLLPRMAGAFGRADWLANGVLFALYHLHQPWVIPATLIDAALLAYPARRYRSAWLGIAVHSAQSLVIGGAVLALVLG
jgi:membrane protease YdiL (CAAX protease family)